jgi:hypothetical protein
MPIGVVQSATNSVTNTTGTLTLTLGTATTAGNCLVVLPGGYCPGAAGNIGANTCTLGGVAGNFNASHLSGAQSSTPDDCAALIPWADWNCAGGQTVISVALTAGTGTFYLFGAAYEISGLLGTAAVVDANVADSYSGSGTSWGGAGAGAMSQASEIIFGSVIADAGTTTITGPASPWANTTALSIASEASFLAGYEILSSIVTPSYTGSFGTSRGWCGNVFSLEAAAAVKPVARRNPLPMQAVKTAAYY